MIILLFRVSNIALAWRLNAGSAAPQWSAILCTSWRAKLQWIRAALTTAAPAVYPLEDIRMPAAKRRRAARAVRPGRHSRPIALLILGPLLCAIALTALGYVGLRQQIQRDAQAQVSVAAQAAHSILLANMGAMTITNGQITSTLPTSTLALNNNTAEAQTLHSQLGVDVLFAQREQGNLVVIASSLASAHQGASPVGLAERLTGSLAANACAPTSGNATSGALTVAGAEYLASSAPLLDGAGTCIGAIFAIRPISELQLVPLQYSVVLAMAGALLTLLTVAIGLALTGRSEALASVAETERVRVALAALDDAQSVCEEQMAQREWINRRIAARQHQLRQVMTALAVDRVALQETTSEVWAGVSQPGAPIAPAAALRLARENAVVAARIGSHLNDFDTATDSLFADMETADEADVLLNDALARTAEAIVIARATINAGEDETPPARANGKAVRQEPLEESYETAILDAQYHEMGAPQSNAPTTDMRQRPEFTASHDSVSEQRMTPEEQARQRRLENLNASGRHSQMGMAGSSGRHRAVDRNQAPFPHPDLPPNGRDRGSSGSRWLND